MFIWTWGSWVLGSRLRVSSKFRAEGVSCKTFGFRMRFMESKV